VYSEILSFHYRLFVNFCLAALRTLRQKRWYVWWIRSSAYSCFAV